MWQRHEMNKSQKNGTDRFVQQSCHKPSICKQKKKKTQYLQSTIKQGMPCSQWSSNIIWQECQQDSLYSQRQLWTVMPLVTIKVMVMKSNFTWIQHSPGFGKGFPSFVSFSSRYNPLNDTDNIIMYKTTLDKRKGLEFNISSMMIISVFLTTVKRDV